MIDKPRSLAVSKVMKRFPRVASPSVRYDELKMIHRVASPSADAAESTEVLRASQSMPLTLLFPRGTAYPEREESFLC